MKLTDKINKFLFDPRTRFQYLVSKGFYDSMLDDKFLKKKFEIEWLFYKSWWQILRKPRKINGLEGSDINESIKMAYLNQT